MFLYKNILHFKGYDIGVTKKEFVNCEWDKMYEAAAQKRAEELEKMESEILSKTDSPEDGETKTSTANVPEVTTGSNVPEVNEPEVESSTNSEEPPEKKARIDCVSIEDDPNKPKEKPRNSNETNDIINSDSDSESVTDRTLSGQPVVEVQLGEYIDAPSGYQTLFHGCELPIQRLLDDAEDSESEDDQGGTDEPVQTTRTEPEDPSEVQTEEKKPSSLETEL